MLREVVSITCQPENYDDVGISKAGSNMIFESNDACSMTILYQFVNALPLTQ